MDDLLRFSGAVYRDPAVEAWFALTDPFRPMVLPWFQRMRDCGADVRELLHDGHPTACVGDAAFGYVNAYTSHVNVGFFRGAELPDPGGLLEGTGRFMRHVKVRPNAGVDDAALETLIEQAYRDMRRRFREAAT